MRQLGSENDHTENRAARNGAAVYEGCPHNRARGSLIPAPARKSSLGWPCPFGAAVQLQARTSEGIPMNCIIHYYPKWPARPATAPGKRPVSIDSVLEKYMSALKLFQAANAHKRLIDPKSPDPIDLTGLAADLTAALRQATGSLRSRPFPFGFKAVIIVSAYGKPNSPFWRGSPPWRGVYHGPWQNEFVGLAAADGHVIFDHIHVPMMGPPYFDLNLPPQPSGIKLHIIVPMPAFFSCDRELPGCTLCAWGC